MIFRDRARYASTGVGRGGPKTGFDPKTKQRFRHSSKLEQARSDFREWYLSKKYRQKYSRQILLERAHRFVRRRHYPDDVSEAVIEKITVHVLRNWRKIAPPEDSSSSAAASDDDDDDEPGPPDPPPKKKRDGSGEGGGAAGAAGIAAI